MRNLFKLLSLGLISLLLTTAAFDSNAQVKKKHAPKSLRDSLRSKVLQRDSLIRSFKKTGDASLDDLLGKIEDYTTLYTQTNSDLSKGFDTLDVSQRLPSLEKRMTIMKTTIDNSSTLEYMVTIRDMIDHISDQMNSWEDLLTKYSTQLDKIHTDIVTFKNDTVLHSAPEDTSLQSKYILQVHDLELKWHKLDSCAKKSIVKIGLLQNRVAALSIKIIDLDDKIDIKIKTFTVKALDNEYGFIWNMHQQKNTLDSALVQTYNLNFRLYRYFFTSKSNYWSHVACIGLLLLFFAWIFNSRRKISRIKGIGAKSIFSQTRYIVYHPYAATLAVVAILAPYFYDHPVQIFTRTMLLITMAAIGTLIKKSGPRPLFDFWLVLMGITILTTISNLLILVTYADRFILLLISVVAIYKSATFLKYLKDAPGDYPPYMEIILKIFIGLNSFALLCNIAGRVSITKIITSAAVFNLCLGMGLYLFVQLLMEGLFLQLEANKSADNESITSYLDFKVLQKKFRDVIIKVSVILWLVALTKNLIIDDYLYDQANEFLTHPYKFSSTAFTFGSVLIFGVVIWISGLVARVISYFYDFAGQQTKLTPQAKKTRSSILLIRLTVFVIGFFVAVNAAGIPMSEVTLVIGALGVGIGFGLQNIVNNLVSGVILAFEKPVQVGDVIEIGGKAGTITDIGIRSSKINIGNGSELIVPNGDLISQQIFNWTLTNNNRQVELVIGVAYGSDVNQVDKLLTDIVNGVEDIMKAPAPVVRLSKFGESSIDFKLLFWSEDIGKADSLKSQVMSLVYTKFTEEGIEIPHPKRDIQVYFPDGAKGFVKEGTPPEKPTENPSDQAG